MRSPQAWEFSPEWTTRNATSMSACKFFFLCGCTDTSACTSNTQTHICTHAHKSQTPPDSSICSPYPLESAPKTKRRRDGLRMLFQPFSFLDNLITSGCGDAARSAPVQGRSLLGPWLKGEGRGRERQATRPVRRDLNPQTKSASDYSIIHL